MFRLIGLLAVAASIAASPAQADLIDDCYRVGTSEPDRTIDICTQAINKGGFSNRDLSSAFNNRGHAKIKKGDFDGAKADIERAIQLNPSNPYAYDNLGDMYREWNRYNEAINAYNQAIRVDPKFLSAYFNRGLTYERMNNPHSARADYETVLKIRDTNREIDEWARRESQRALDRLNGKR
jgi:tetratricopeptide (TPR) repeat protein